jgi:hypothetical protein
MTIASSYATTFALVESEASDNAPHFALSSRGRGERVRPADLGSPLFQTERGRNPEPRTIRNAALRLLASPIRSQSLERLERRAPRDGIEEKNQL